MQNEHNPVAKKANSMAGVSDTNYMWYRLSQNEFPSGNDGVFLSEEMRDFFAPYFSKHGSKTKIIAQIDVEKSQGNDILSGKKQTTLDIYVQIALALGLDVGTTQRMLGISKRGGLHPRIRRDAAAIFAINHGYSVAEYKAFMRELGEKAPPSQEALERMDIPDTYEMWKLLEGDTFPDADYLLEDIKTFLEGLLTEMGKKKKDLKDGSAIEEGYFKEIMNGSANATRDYYIRLALALEIDLRTTQRMLAVAKWGTLHPLVKRDAAIIYSINHQYDFDETNAFLYELEQDLLTQNEKGMN